jgi:hypothetical protein
MDLKQIIERFNTLNIQQKRSIEDEYVEIVVLTKEIDQWSQVAGEFFGPAIKPMGAKPDHESLKLTQAFGGIRDNQALFKKELDGKTTVAMFWPWQDGVHTTLKIFVLPA